MQTFSIGIMGDINTGKSMLISKYLGKNFGFLNEMNGSGPYIKEISSDNINYRLSIWDLIAQERYRSVTFSMLKIFKGLILLYSIIERSTFENVKNVWIKSIYQKIKDFNGTSKIPIIIVGNKKDLEDERDISEEEGRKFAEDNNFKFFETSAITGENVNEVFQKILEMMIKENKSHNNNNQNIIGLKNNKIDKKRSCIII